MKVTIKALVDGGAASAGPPLGPALGPLGVNIGKIIGEINEKTKEFKGLKVPVEVIVDRDTKEFEIKVGSPPVSALIKKELGIEKGAKTREEKVGDLSLEKVVEIARMKSRDSLGKTLKARVKEVLGTCLSMGVTVNGKDPREVVEEVNEGKHDSLVVE